MKKLLLLILCITLSPLAHAMEQPKDLIQAAKDGDLARVRELIWKSTGIKNRIDREAYLDQTDDEGQTPLIWAAYNGHLEIIKELLAAGADVNAQSNEGNTPLMNALAGQHPEIAKELMQAKNIDLNIQNNGGQTALDHAIYSKTLHDVAQELLQDKNFNPEVQKEALLTASNGGFVKFVKALIWLNCDIDYIDITGNNSLIIAVNDNHLDVAKALLTEFSNADAERIRNTLLPLYWAAKQSLPLGALDFSKIAAPIISDLVDERLERARKSMRIKDWRGLTTQEMAEKDKHQELAALLDPNNQKSQDELRELIKKNIYAILRESQKEAREPEAKRPKN